MSLKRFTLLSAYVTFFLRLPYPGIYAIRHRTAGVLYIGQTKKLRRRFKNGHKAFFWALLDDYSPDDIRIAVEFLGLQSLRRAKALETIMIENAVPPYCDPEDEE